MNWKHEILCAISISAVYLFIFMIAELWRKFGKPSCEVTRKFVHFASGVACLSFAYLFKSHWTVLILCAGFFIIMIITKQTKTLCSVHGVDRKTSGGMYYPLAVYLTFFIAHTFNRPHYYLISILVLAISDSVAALFGKKYGFKIYTVEENTKSLEGSVMFFTVTFIIVFLGTLLANRSDYIHPVLIALLLSLLVTGFESISLGGTDNIFIPLGTIAVLLKTETQRSSYIAIKTGIVIVLVIAIYFISRRRGKLGISAIIGIALIGYAAGSLVAWHWIFPVIIGIAVFSFMDIFVEDSIDLPTIYRIRPVFFILLVSFIWILAANFTQSVPSVFYTGYTTNFAANLAILWRRKSKLVKQGVCSSITPAYICHAPLLVRALVLTVLLVPATAAIDPVISLPLSLGLCFIGTTCIELIYWMVENRKRGRWKDITFIRFTSLVSFIITCALTLISWWYYKAFSGISGAVFIDRINDLL